MKVCWLTTDWSNITDEAGNPTAGGAGWYRIQMPQRYLSSLDTSHEHVLGKDLGWEADGTMTVSDWTDEWHTPDVIVMSRWMDQEAPDLILRARRQGQTVINDVDDWMFGLDPHNAAYWATHPKANEKTNRDHYRRVLTASSGLLVSTPYLAGRLHHINPNTHVVRNAIDLSRWEANNKLYDQVVVGWVGSTMNRSHDLQTVSGVLREFLSTHDGSFFHGGAAPGGTKSAEVLDPAWKLLGLDDIPVKSMPMLGILDYPRFFQKFNVGIVPLSMQPFNLAKSFIKGLEYAAAGLPFVAQATPEYRLLEQMGVGFTAQRPRDWRGALKKLADPRVRLNEGKNNRIAVAQFDMKDRWKDWVQRIEHIAGR